MWVGRSPLHLLFQSSLKQMAWGTNKERDQSVSGQTIMTHEATSRKRKESLYRHLSQAMLKI